MRHLTLAVLAVSTFVGCAHTPPPDTTETVKHEVQPPPKPQLVATTTAVAVDPAAELEAALKSATVFFDFDADRLKPEGMQALQRVGEILRRNPSVGLKIEGNCDERGTEEYNLHLGQRRAEVAKKYLAALGVNARQLDTISYGALRPANPQHTEDAYSQNRRDELHATR